MTSTTLPQLILKLESMKLLKKLIMKNLENKSTAPTEMQLRRRSDLPVKF